MLDLNYFKDYYKMIAIDLSKQQEIDADPKAIQKINFTGNLKEMGMKIQQCSLLLKNQKKLF